MRIATCGARTSVSGITSTAAGDCSDRRNTPSRALGTMVAPSLAAAETLAAQGVQATVVNARFAAPLDATMFTGLAQSTGRIVTVEENVTAGGFGSAVSEMFAAAGVTVPTLHLGVPNEFVLHGKRDELLAQVGLDAKGIAERVLAFVRQPHHQYH